MTDPVLHYFYDPLCGWCYAAAPLVRAASDAGVQIAMLGGGLWDQPQPYPHGMMPHIRVSDAKIAAMTGQPYGPAYLDGLLSNPATVLHSRPPIAAVLAAEQLGAGKGLVMLAALQAAHFVDGRPIVEPAVLNDVAASIGLNAVMFASTLGQVKVDGHIAATRQAMRDHGLNGYPSFVLQLDHGRIRLAHDGLYGDPSGFTRLIDRTVATNQG